MLLIALLVLWLLLVVSPLLVRLCDPKRSTSAPPLSREVKAGRRTLLSPVRLLILLLRRVPLRNTIPLLRVLLRGWPGKGVLRGRSAAEPVPAEALAETGAGREIGRAHV